jgi:beta-N-acetylhexosaminidase
MSSASPPHAEGHAPAAIILGCAGHSLTAEERAFYRDFDPLGFILFARNCDTPEQVKALTADLRACVGRADAPILIDQEGGRVARLKPPYWPAFPAMSQFGRMAATDVATAREACFLNALLIGCELARLGIDVDCAPVLDLPVAGAHDIIGDRALARGPRIIATLGRAVCEGLAAAGVISIVKHIPGHGRATADSHAELPRVDTPVDELAVTDFAPFADLHDAPWAMIAHVLFTAIDAGRPASTSPVMVDEIIRRRIGFGGVLIADDIGMEALKGSLAERAVATLASGADLTLHCSGRMDEMLSIAASVTRLTPDSQRRLDIAGRNRGSVDRIEADEARRRYDDIMRDHAA